MEIGKQKVVAIDYTLQSPQGEVIDSSEGKEPLTYVHGVGGIIPGLENALEGKSAGDQINITVPPAEGYGERDDQLVQDVPRDRFSGVKDLSVGMQLQAQSQEGSRRVVTIVGMEGDNVRVDANHPLAGVPLSFDVKVVDVREATPEELRHGHAHGPGGHHH